MLNMTLFFYRVVVEMYIYNKLPIEKKGRLKIFPPISIKFMALSQFCNNSIYAL